MVVRDAARMWLRRRASEVAPKTAEYVAAMVRRWIEKWGSWEVDQVGVGEVVGYEGERAGKVKAGGLNSERVYLRQFFGFCREMGWREDDPVRVWSRRVEVVAKEYRVVGREEEAALVGELGAETVEGRYVRFAVATGLRQGTIRELRGEHVRGGVLWVPAEIVKQRRAHRVLLHKRAEEVVRGRTGRLFAGLPEGSTLNKRLKRAAARAGLEAPLPGTHDLRRTWVARLVEAGATEIEMLKLGGWASLPVMAQHYYVGVDSVRENQLLGAL